MQAGRWVPRIIDIDIVMYHDQHLTTDQLTLPHVQMENRDFWKYLLEILGCPTGDLKVNNYRALNYFVLEPKIILESVVTSVPKEIPLAVDTYFDEVINFCLDHANIEIVNDIKFNLSDRTLKRLADRDVKIVTMLTGTDFSHLQNQVDHLKKCGLKHIIVDPGIGFGKTKFENLTILKNAKKIKSLGCEILIGHSRKSFFSLISNKEAKDRDIETLAVSDVMQNFEIDYLRIHNLEYHIKFFTVKKIMQL